MKVRDSGMPDEKMWEGFFDACGILAQLDFTDHRADVVDFGCGYGTFTIAVARGTVGTVHALDFEPAMVKATATRAELFGLANVRVVRRDFVLGDIGSETTSGRTPP